MNSIIPEGVLNKITNYGPEAYAIMQGSEKYPNINGKVLFYQLRNGVLVAAEVRGLPEGKGECNNKVFGFHIHEGKSCMGTGETPFTGAKSHFNPWGCPHPEHAGDMPPLFGNNGYAWTMFYTDRFNVPELIGRTVIIHSNPDDFTTQPSGNAGEMMACGVIE